MSLDPRSWSMATMSSASKQMRERRNVPGRRKNLSNIAEQLGGRILESDSLGSNPGSPTHYVNLGKLHGLSKPLFLSAKGGW